MVNTEHDWELDAIVELPQRLETSGLGLPTITLGVVAGAFVLITTPLGTVGAGLGAGLGLVAG